MTSIRLAPMAGITDWPFRVLCFEQGCDVATTEMVSAMGYLYAPRNHPATVSLIERRDSEGKLLVQIFGKEGGFDGARGGRAVRHGALRRRGREHGLSSA